jgi:hypothetical protein
MGSYDVREDGRLSRRSIEAQSELRAAARA